MDAEATRALVGELAGELRERVLPALGSHAGRAHSEDAAAGGDVTFAIDADAEAHLAEFIERRAPTFAFYSEDRGLVEPAGPAEHVLVVDPIDGTRPALAGFEAACVSVALAPARGPHGEPPTLGDVTVGCVVEIKSGTRFLTRRGGGLESDARIAPSANERVERAFWTYGLRGRPARPTIAVLAELIDASSVGGATFELGSAAYDTTRVATGQLDAYVEPGPRIVAEVPGMEEEFRRVGGGEVLCNSPYDLAAAVLCATEAGAIVTDAAGRSLEGAPLLGSGADHQLSVVVAANRALHGAIVASLDRGIGALRGP